MVCIEGWFNHRLHRDTTYGLIEFPMASCTTLSWESCPEELLWMIFKYSSTKCLLSCMTVNRRWKDIVLDYIESHSLWPTIASETMVNNGRTFKRKSVLSFKDMLMNSMLWPFVRQAKIKLHHKYTLQDIRNIQVLKDNMILTVDVRTTDMPIRYFNIQNTELKKGLECKAKKIDMSENEYMRVSVEHMLFAYGKENPNDPINSNERVIAFKIDILVYTLEANVCYIVTKRHIICALTWDLKRWDLSPRGRYYGNAVDIPCGIQLYNERVCLITKLGFILCEDRQTKLYQKQNSYNLVPRIQDSTVLVLFSQKGVAISVSDSDQRVKVCQEQDTNVVWLECAHMTCATEHGEVLFIGYKDGTVAICTPHTMTPTHGQRDRLFNVQEFDDSIEDPSILGVEVFEDKLSHHLLVATQHKVLQLLITYPDHIRSYFD